VQAVFNYLTSNAEEPYRPLLVAPLSLAEDVLGLIKRETAHARAGRRGMIIAKMNALLDRLTVEALYEASCAGVQIELIVRGMCSLRPGIKGLSANIKVRSIIGQFLEHSRIFWFANGGASEVFCGSADWMSRNLYDRCEVVFPVTEPDLAGRLREEILGAYLRDTAKVRFLQADGTYSRPAKELQVVCAQDELVGLAKPV
jgi:polyphosphate kinase